MILEKIIAKKLFEIYLDVLNEAYDDFDDERPEEKLIGTVNDVLYSLVKGFPRFAKEMEIRGESDFNKFLKERDIESIETKVSSALSDGPITIFNIKVSDLTSLMQSIENKIRAELGNQGASLDSKTVNMLKRMFPVFSWYHSAGKKTKTQKNPRVSKTFKGVEDNYTGDDYDVEVKDGQFVWTTISGEEKRSAPDSVNGRIIYFKKDDTPISLENLPKEIKLGVDFEARTTKSRRGNLVVEIPSGFTLTSMGESDKNPSITFKNCTFRGFSNIESMKAKEAIEFMFCDGIDEIDGSKFETYKFICPDGKYDPKNLPASTFIVTSFENASEILKSFRPDSIVGGNYMNVLPYAFMTNDGTISTNLPNIGTTTGKLADVNKRTRIKEFYQSFYGDELSNEQINKMVNAQATKSKIPLKMKIAIDNTLEMLKKQEIDKKIIQVGKQQAGMKRNKWYVSIYNANSPIKYSILQFDALNRKEKDGPDSAEWEKNPPQEKTRPQEKSEED